MIGTLSHVSGFKVHIDGKMFYHKLHVYVVSFPVPPRVDFHVFTRFLSFRITIVELDVNSCATFSAIIEIISALSHADC